MRTSRATKTVIRFFRERPRTCSQPNARSGGSHRHRSSFLSRTRAGKGQWRSRSDSYASGRRSLSATRGGISGQRASPSLPGIAPFFAPLLALFFRGRGYMLVDHLVFAVHLNSFALLTGLIRAGLSRCPARCQLQSRNCFVPRLCPRGMPHLLRCKLDRVDFQGCRRRGAGPCTFLPCRARRDGAGFRDSVVHETRKRRGRFGAQKPNHRHRWLLRGPRAATPPPRRGA